MAELLPRHGEYDSQDHYPDYFSAETYWTTAQFWEFIGVPFEVVEIAFGEAAELFRDRLRASLGSLLPKVASDRQANFSELARNPGPSREP